MNGAASLGSLPPHGLATLSSGASRVLVVRERSTRESLEPLLRDHGVAVLAGTARHAWDRLAGRGKIVVTDIETGHAILAAGAVGVAIIPPEALDEASAADAVLDRIKTTARRLEPASAADQKAPPITPAAITPATAADSAAAFDERPPPDIERPDDFDDMPMYDVGGVHDAPFQALGYDRRRYYFARRDGGQIIDLSARDIREIACLIELAPASYWQMNFPAQNQAKFDGVAACNALVAACRAAGVFDPDRVRGRGVWLDDGRAVMHLGDGLLVDGAPCKISALASDYIYEQARRLPVALADPLPPAEAKKLADICAMLRHERPEMAMLLAGFLVIAPVCGAMPWRPHAWITGPSGSGKTWVLDNICRPVIGSIALRVQSKSTEAGIRQELGSDARPVVFDEAENQNKHDVERMQLVLDLARQASSEDGAPITKGTQSGRAQTFRIRSCFLYSSVVPGGSQAADESRTVLFPLRGTGDLSEEGRLESAQAFAALKRLASDTLTPGWCAGLLTRTLSMLPTIRDNAVTMAEAAAEHFGSRRQGDTMGAMLAGYHSLFSAKRLTLDEARRFMAERSWVQKAAEVTVTVADHDRALDHLLEYMVRVQPATGQPFERPAVTLIMAVAEAKTLIPGKIDEDHEVDGVRAGVAARTLGDLGVKVDPHLDVVWLAQGHSRLSAILANTPWATNWREVLARIAGAERPKNKSARFGQMVKKVGVGIPISQIIKEEQ